MEKIKKLKKKGFITQDGAILALMIAGLASALSLDPLIKIARREERPSQIEIVSDLNQDKINDVIVINQKGYITPFFGNSTNKIYVTANTLQKSNTNDYFNYSKLEEDLNKK